MAAFLHFYPRSPCGERLAPKQNTAEQRNFYPRSPCGERLINNPQINKHDDFYPRSPCGERRRCFSASLNRFGFLSTLSLRRATGVVGIIGRLLSRFLSTLSLRRATVPVIGCLSFIQFLSTLSLRRATFFRFCWHFWVCISIHALLAESDGKEHAIKRYTIYFYPRSPCGERRILAHDGRKVVKFLSTLSLRRATTEPIENEVEAHISIHALLAESDELHASSAKSRWRFLSTLSLRRATGSVRAARRGGRNFYPRSPCGERL